MRAPRRSIGVAMSRYSSLSVSPNFNNEQVRVFKLYATPHSLSYDACGIDNNQASSSSGFKLLHFCGKGAGNPLLEES